MFPKKIFFLREKIKKVRMSVRGWKKFVKKIFANFSKKNFFLYEKFLRKNLIF